MTIRRRAAPIGPLLVRDPSQVRHASSQASSGSANEKPKPRLSVTPLPTWPARSTTIWTPALPKSAGVSQSRPGKPLFSSFADSAPDRWGQTLCAVKSASARQLRAAYHAAFATESSCSACETTPGKEHPDEWDVAGWEEIQLRLARRSGITVGYEARPQRAVDASRAGAPPGHRASGPPGRHWGVTRQALLLDVKEALVDEFVDAEGA